VKVGSKIFMLLKKQLVLVCPSPVHGKQTALSDKQRSSPTDVNKQPYLVHKGHHQFSNV